MTGAAPTGRKMIEVFDCSPLNTRAGTSVAGLADPAARGMPTIFDGAVDPAPPTVTSWNSRSVNAGSVTASAHTRPSSAGPMRLPGSTVSGSRRDTGTW